MDDLEKRQWSIYWVSSERGKGEPPIVGGFEGDHGEFYGEDQDNGRPVKVRYTWDKLDRDHARWQQAFFYDDRGWEPAGRRTSRGLIRRPCAKPARPRR